GADLTLPTGGTLKLESNGGGLNIAGSIAAASGTVQLTSATGKLPVAGSAGIDDSGQWINSQLGQAQGQPLSAFGSTGGSISISFTHAVNLAQGRVLNGSGPVHTNGRISGGKAGSIALSAGQALATPDAADRALSLGATLEGYSTTAG